MSGIINGVYCSQQYVLLNNETIEFQELSQNQYNNRYNDCYSISISDGRVMRIQYPGNKFTDIIDPRYLHEINRPIQNSLKADITLNL